MKIIFIILLLVLPLAGFTQSNNLSNSTKSRDYHELHYNVNMTSDMYSNIIKYYNDEKNHIYMCRYFYLNNCITQRDSLIIIDGDEYINGNWHHIKGISCLNKYPNKK